MEDRGYFIVEQAIRIRICSKIHLTGLEKQVEHSLLLSQQIDLAISDEIFIITECFA